MKFTWVKPFPQSEWIRLHHECLGARTTSTFERSGRWEGVLRLGFATLRKHVDWTARVDESDGIEMVVQSDTPLIDWRVLLFVVVDNETEVYVAPFQPCNQVQTLRLPYTLFEKTCCLSSSFVPNLTKGAQQYVTAIAVQARDPKNQWRPLPFHLEFSSLSTFSSPEEYECY